MDAPIICMLELISIKDVPTTIKIPQANGICDWLHQSIGNTLRAPLSYNIPQDVVQANNIMDTCLLQLDIPLLTDFHVIHKQRQLIVNEWLQRATLKRRTYDNQIGKEVLILAGQADILQSRRRGPCRLPKFILVEQWQLNILCMYMNVSIFKESTLLLLKSLLCVGEAQYHAYRPTHHRFQNSDVTSFLFNMRRPGSRTPKSCVNYGLKPWGDLAIKFIWLSVCMKQDSRQSKDNRVDNFNLI